MAHTRRRRIAHDLAAAAALLVPLVIGAEATPTASELPPNTIQAPAEGMTWSDGPPSLPAGTKVMRLEGDPAKEGIFTFRLLIPAGAFVEPHWHPQDERVTILSGEARVGFGDVPDRERMTRFGPGSFYVNPATSRHFVWFPEETVIQITGFGPWVLHYLTKP